MLSCPDIAFVIEKIERIDETPRQRKKRASPHRAIPNDFTVSVIDALGALVLGGLDFGALAVGDCIRRSTSH